MSFTGAEYKKAQLQLHSPRDRGWQGERPEPPEGQSTPDERRASRRAWCRQFIGKCVAEQLQAIAITDHHEGIYCWDLIAELEAMRAENDVALWVFPGMELTAMDSAQALMIFDAALPRVLFEKARNRLGLPADCNELSDRGIEVELLNRNVADLESVLNGDDELKGRFIILPNVTPRGHKTVLRAGFHKRFKEMPYVGGYLDKCYPQDLDDGDRRILEGAIPAWTSERRGIVATCDAREADLERVGTYPTWIKMAEPTAESLRQAMLAADSRILYGPFRGPETAFRVVEVLNPQFLDVGQIEVSRQFNALIGGRGAGKSTFLEFLRYVVGSSAVDLAGEWDPTHDRRREILEEALGPHGGIRATLDLEGARVVLTRRRDTEDLIEWNVDGLARPLSPADVRTMIPVQAYSQGELSLLGHAAAEARLRQLITDPARVDLDRIRNDLEASDNELGDVLQRLVTAWTIDQDIRRAEAEIATIETRIANLRAQLADGPAAAQEVANSHTRYLAISGWIESLPIAQERATDIVTTAVRNAIMIMDVALRDAAVLESDQVNQASRALTAFVDVLNDTQTRIAAADLQATHHIGLQREAWAAARRLHDEEYERALQELAGQRATAEALSTASENLAARRADLEILVTRRAELATAERRMAEIPVERGATHDEWLAITARQVGIVATSSKGLARATVEAKGDLDEIWEAMKGLFTGCNVRETRQRELLAAVELADNTIAEWWEILAEILSILRWKTSGMREAERRPQAAHLDAVIDAGGLERFCDRLTTERVLACLKVKVPPRIRVTQRRGEVEVDFRIASQGEKAATLLTILMNQPGGPLIIDQPEEDLDNRIIGDIVAITRAAKLQRQLIFATHNANLVVNADAELVLDLTTGRIAARGAIDAPLVKDSITATMEGGREAFELRRRKYNY
jgi:chromosome segregation protein